MIATLFPGTTGLDRRTQGLLVLCFGVLAAAFVCAILHVVFGIAGSWTSALKGPVPAAANVAAAVVVIVRACVERERRPVWILVAAALSSYAIAFVLWGTWLEYQRHPPDPSVSDGFWMAMYPLLVASFVVAGRGYSSRGFTFKIWLDGILAATAVAALAVAFVLPPVLHSAQRSDITVTTNLVYPMADLVIGVLMVALIGIRGWQLDRKWVLVLCAFCSWTAADCLASTQIISGAITGDTLTTLLYIVAFSCVAAATWSPEVHPRGRSRDHWTMLVMPFLFTLVAPTILVIDHFSRVPLGALVLTLIALAVAMVRMAVALGDIRALGDMQRAAATDELTQLPNRRSLYTSMAGRLAEHGRTGTPVTVMMLDLDNFKQLNDTLGHDAGDELLRLIGPRLHDVLRDDDVVARLGGDEFAILLGDGPEPPTQVAEAVLQSLRSPFNVQDLTIRLTASVGIAAFPDDADGIDSLMKCADIAMYDAKRSHRGWEHYAFERDANTTERLVLAGELANAVDSGEGERRESGSGSIVAYFQPVADTGSGRITGAEALARWHRADGSVLPPSQFIDAAELAGLARPLTRRILRLTLSQVAQWRAAGHDLLVSINATVSDLLDDTFPDEVTDVLKTHAVPPSRLVIEVTESSIMADPSRIVVVLGRLRELGVKIALDDFGTGYSSLSHLRELPVDFVKIDRSFVMHMCDEPTDAAIVHATVELAHRLGLGVVAEGVENARTWAALDALGTERVQGYALGRPLPAAEFSERLLIGNRRTGDGAHLALSQSRPAPASTESGGSIG